MDFEWDESENEKNRRVHGLSFEDAALVFLDPCRSIFLDDREDYGEERATTFGTIEGRIFAVTYTMRGDVIRIISARKANSRERKRHEGDDIQT